MSLASHFLITGAVCQFIAIHRTIYNPLGTTGKFNSAGDPRGGILFHKQNTSQGLLETLKETTVILQVRNDTLLS